MAARGARVCFETPNHYSDCVVAPKQGRGGDEHHGVRWAVDTQGHRVAGIRDGAGEFVSRRIARARGDGKAAGRGSGLRVHDRRAAGTEIRCETGSGDAGAKKRMSHPGIPHRRGPRQDLRANVGPFSAAGAFRAYSDSVRASDLCSQRCGCGSNGSKAQGNATRTRTRSRYCGGMVFAERARTRKTARSIQFVSEADQPQGTRRGGCPYCWMLQLPVRSPSLTGTSIFLPPRYTVTFTVSRGRLRLRTTLTSS